jgi:hypothetical protein
MNARILRVMVLSVLVLAGAKGVAEEYRLFARTNLVAIIERLRGEGIVNVGIVYNQHHGHDHVDRFRQLLRLMKPHLLCLNLNGMVRGGDRLGKKIVVLGQGELDLNLLRLIQESGWRGPVGILNHTDEDAEVRLRENLEGLERLVRQLKVVEPGIEEPPADQREESLPPTGSGAPSSRREDWFSAVAGQQCLVIAATGGGKLGMPAGDAYVAFAFPATGRDQARPTGGMRAAKDRG